MSGSDSNAPLRRRPLLAALLLLCVLSSLGHSAGSPGDLAQSVLDPEPPGCADNTLALEATGDGQSGFAGAPLPQPLTVVVTCLSKRDRNRLLVRDAMVAWEATSGGGAVEGQPRMEQTPKSDPNGYTVNWQLGDVVGTQSVIARSQGLSKVFTATGLSPKPGGGCEDNTPGTGTDFGAAYTIRGNERWPLGGSPYRVSSLQLTGGQLSIDAGVQVCATNVAVFDAARLLVQGRAELPVRIDPLTAGAAGLVISFHNNALATPPSPSEFLHTRVRRLATLQADSHALRIEDSTFSNDGTGRGQPGCGWVRLRSAVADLGPTTVLRSTFDGFGGSGGDCAQPGVLLDDFVSRGAVKSVFAARVIRSPGTGVQVIAAGTGTSHWAFENCELARNGGDGLVLLSPVRQVDNCAFSQNGGVGLRNGSPTAFAVTARSNWWGDAAGPGGPSGDGVSAGVDFTPFLTVPPSLGY